MKESEASKYTKLQTERMGMTSWYWNRDASSMNLNAEVAVKHRLKELLPFAPLQRYPYQCQPAKGAPNPSNERAFPCSDLCREDGLHCDR